MAKKEVKQQGPSDITVLMNWARDGNMKSEFPKQLAESKSLSPIYMLVHFLTSPRYFIFINNLFNNYNMFLLKNKDVFMMFKEIIHNTGYSSFSKGKVSQKENPLIKLLKHKFPYYKKEEIMMAVNIIDNSDDKDIIYEMFGINNVAKVKKMTKKDISERQNKIKNIISSDDVLSMI